MLKNYLSLTTNTFIAFCCIFVFMLSACSEGDLESPMDSLTIQDERNIATRIHNIILADEYHTVLDRDTYSEAYAYLSDKVRTLTNCELVGNSGTYNWKIYILDNADTNAFTTPGGYIYFDKGLLKAIDSEASFMNFLSNEIAYADLGFARAKLETNFSLLMLLEFALGNTVDDENELVEVLSELPYSASVAEKADDYMLQLTCHKNYDVEQIIDFFSERSSITWLNTHPTESLDKRINYIRQFACTSADTVVVSGDDPYIRFKETF